jgi:hypothetical protein
LLGEIEPVLFGIEAKIIDFILGITDELLRIVRLLRLHNRHSRNDNEEYDKGRYPKPQC